jgi:uncharacterized RmlC-like cupin family protein/GNAT superfamily N-acetyltransferase
VTHTISPPVVVREILPDEHDAAASLLLTVYRAFDGGLPPALLHRWLRDVVDPAGGTALGAHVGGRLVGTARLHLDGTYPVPLPPGAAGVRAVAVDPSVRRIGVASALMAECEARARTAGATALHLHTAPFMHAAVALYERLGYRPDPARDLDVAGHFAPDDPVHAGRGIIATAYRLDLVPTCRIVHPGDMYEGRQGLTYAAGVSAQSVGARGLCLHTLTVPAGGRAAAHRHEAHESAIYMVSGKGEVWWGEGLGYRHEVTAGDFVYIPAGVPHLPINTGDEPIFAVIGRTDPNEQESVVLMPELDDIHTARSAS